MITTRVACEYNDATIYRLNILLIILKYAIKARIEAENEASERVANTIQHTMNFAPYEQETPHNCFDV